MPVFDYGCDCGAVREVLVSDPGDAVACECGGGMVRMFSPTTNLRLAEWARRENEDSNARHRQWMRTPEVQAKLRSGEYEADTSNRSCENGDGVGNSSSIVARMEAGLPIAG